MIHSVNQRSLHYFLYTYTLFYTYTEILLFSGIG